jgi:hypothetical protein
MPTGLIIAIAVVSLILSGVNWVVKKLLPRVDSLWVSYSASAFALAISILLGVVMRTGILTFDNGGFADLGFVIIIILLTLSSAVSVGVTFIMNKVIQ